MLLKHKVTGKMYPVSPEAWAKIKKRGNAGTYDVLEAPATPKELKNVRPAKEEKKAESEINDDQRITDPVSDKDPG